MTPVDIVEPLKRESIIFVPLVVTYRGFLAEILAFVTKATPNPLTL
jgi:hypothetical protein